MCGYVYKTTNLVNGKIYIGQHRKSFFDTKYFGSGFLIREALDKYGKDNFKCEVIEWCETEEELTKRETYWIEYYKSTVKGIGYNLARIGSGSSDRQRKVASAYMRTRTITEETKRRMSLSAKKRTPSKNCNNKNKVWINNGTKELPVCVDELKNYPDFVFGRLSNNYTKYGAKEKYQNGVYVHKDDLTKFVSKEEVEQYLDSGFVLGKSTKNYSNERNEKVKQSKSGTIAITDGQKNYFIKPELLTEYESRGFVKGTYQALNRLKNLK